MKQLNNCQSVIRLPKELKDNIKKYSSLINISYSRLIRDAINKEIDKLIEIESLIHNLEN